MTKPADCPNHETNLQMCPCTEVNCPRRGICCECIIYHRNSAQWPLTSCMKIARPEATLSLPMQTPDRCANYERNLANCTCASADCERKGTCCDCMRNHWKVDGESRPSCLREAS